MAKTDINIFENRGEDISHLVTSLESVRTVPTFSPAELPPTPDGVFKPMPSLSEMLDVDLRQNNIERLTREREEFYADSKPLQIDNVTSSVGFNIVDDTLVAVVTKNGLKMFNAGYDLELMQAPNSPLAFEIQLNNLSTLYDYLGDTAAQQKDVFDSAVQVIIDDFISKGGAFINADKEGVADSIHAFFNGEEGKYTLDDLKTMVVLSFENVGLYGGDSSSEHQVGASFGYQALNIEMAFRAGKLSDAAYATVKDMFATQVDDYIKLMDRYQTIAKTDPFGPKGVTYSPIRPDLVYKSIDIMLGALDNDDFNQGLREALRTLENMHTAQRDSQLEEKGEADQRLSLLFAGSLDARIRTGDNIQVSSRFFTEYLNRPEWTISGNPFSVSITV
jgi:hypothetical protein